MPDWREDQNRALCVSDLRRGLTGVELDRAMTHTARVGARIQANDGRATLLAAAPPSREVAPIFTLLRRGALAKRKAYFLRGMLGRQFAEVPRLLGWRPDRGISRHAPR
jgi:hypothetical protein